MIDFCNKMATRISNPGGSTATVSPQLNRDVSRGSIPLISLGNVSQVITTCLLLSISELRVWKNSCCVPGLSAIN